MSTSGKEVFLIGPGYIGLEVLDRLLENKYNVTALVRREAAARDLEKMGVKPVMGSLEDSETIQRQTAKSDIVFHTATADDISSVKAVIAGIEERASQDLHTIYIHTSGCTFLCDDSGGEYASDMVYSDTKPEDLDARPDSSSHREIDLAIISARKSLGTKAKLFIMLPPLIYGATHHNRLSIQVITMARFAIANQYAGHVGKGKSLWGLIHVNDLSYGYLTILQWLEQAPPEAALEHPYFFCENGKETSWRDAAGIIGDELTAAGKLSDPAPREIPKDQYAALFGPYSMVVLGQNARNRADRLRKLGWEAKHYDVRQAFREEELPLLLKEDLSGYSGYDKPAASGSG